MFKQAVKYGELGLKVFPVSGKIPAVNGWKALATSDPEKLKELFKVPHTGIGLATGNVSGVTVVDVDNKNGVNGFLTLKNLGISLPNTVCILTPGGGCHFYFKYTAALKNMISALNQRSGIDIKNDGGLVILPPSIHPNGEAYEFQSEQGIGEIDYAEFPIEILEAIERSNSKGRSPFKLEEVIPKGHRNDHLFKCGCKLRAVGMQDDEILEALVAINNKRTESKLLEDEIIAIVRSISKYPEHSSMNFNTRVLVNTDEKDNLPSVHSHLQDEIGITKTLQGQPICNVDNVLKVLERCKGLKNEIWYDEFYQKIFTTLRTGFKREWSEAETVALQVSLQRSVGLSRLGKEVVVDAVLIYSRYQTRNELKDKMESYMWDKKPRIDKLFIDYYGAEDNDYTRAASKNFIVSIVARIYSPGCKVDTMPVIQGGQGTFKSTGVEALIGKEFYCDAHESVTSKDFFQIFPGKALIEIAELDAFSRAEVTRVKQIITCKNDRYRGSYARFAEDHPRQCVFVGTTNEENYLKDLTGARRFWPIKTGFINIPLIKSDREQLLAEAVYSFKNGATWWEMPSSTQEEQEDRRQTDPWEDVIQEYLERLPMHDQQVTTKEVLTVCLHIDVSKQTRSDQMRVGGILRHLGWKRTKKRSGASKNVYVPEIATQNVEVGNENTNLC